MCRFGDSGQSVCARGLEVTREMKRDLISLEREQKWGPSSLKTARTRGSLQKGSEFGFQISAVTTFSATLPRAAARKFMKLIVGPFSNPFAFKAVACSPSCRSAWPLAAHPH